MKKRTLNDLRQSKQNYYEHPYHTKGVNVKELFNLPVRYTNDAELGRAFREMIAEATDIKYKKEYD